MAIKKINFNGVEFHVGGSGGGSDLNTTFKIAYIGDSITDERVGYQMSGNFTYPRQLNRLMGATSYASTAVAGNSIVQHLATQVATVSTSHKDSDLVIVMLGINDAYQGSQSSYTALGDASAIASASKADCAPGGTYGSTVLGIFKYQLMLLREALDTNANALGHICVVSPIGSSLDYGNDSTLATYLTNMREGMRKIVGALGTYSGSIYNGWYYIDGKEIFPYKVSYDSTAIVHSELVKQGVHPNLQGEGMIAKGIFNRLPDLKLYKFLGLNE